MKFKCCKYIYLNVFVLGNISEDESLQPSADPDDPRDTSAHGDTDNDSIHTSTYQSHTPSQSDSDRWSELTRDSQISASDDISAADSVPTQQDLVRVYKSDDQSWISEDQSEHLSDAWIPQNYGFESTTDLSTRIRRSFPAYRKAIAQNVSSGSFILDLCSSSSDDIEYIDPNIHNKNRKEKSLR